MMGVLGQIPSKIQGVFASAGTWLVGIALLVSSLAAEPINGTFYYGQINILLMFLVSLDFLPCESLGLPRQTSWHHRAR